MFGIGFGELVIIGIIALLVLGPDQLPGIASKVGRFVWDLRRAWDDVKDQVRTEVMTVKQPFDEIRRTTRDTRDLLVKEARDAKDSAEATVRDARKEIEEAAKPAPPAPASAAEVASENAGVTPATPAAAEPAAEEAVKPQPYKRPSAPAAATVFYDLDGNPIEPGA